MYFPVNIAKFKNSIFTQKLWWLLFSVWKSNCSELGICRPSLLNQKHNVGWFLLKRFVDLFRVRHIISTNYSSTFLSAGKQKLVQDKTLQQGLFVLVLTFDSLDILISAELSLVLREFKLYQENLHGREVRFNEPVQAEKVAST